MQQKPSSLRKLIFALFMYSKVLKMSKYQFGAVTPFSQTLSTLATIGVGARRNYSK